MDDPWAGPSWSTPSKPTSSVHMTMPSPGRNTPPPRFDDSDPWGTSQAPEKTPETPAQNQDQEEDERQVDKGSLETPGWGGADHASWGAGGEEENQAQVASPVEEGISPKVDQGGEDAHDEPSWGISTISVDNATSPPGSPTQDPSPSILPQTSLQQLSPPPPKPTSPPGISSPTFASSSPSHPPPTFDSPLFASSPQHQSTIPRSPSFGDDFGGFSAGPAFPSSGGDDPWGNNAAGPSTINVAKDEPSGWGGEDLSWGGGKNDISWGGDMSFGDESETSFKSPIIPQEIHEDTHEEEEEEADGEGWGSGGKAAPPAMSSQPKGDDDWEEAQRRIRVKQERAPQDKIDELTKAWTDLLGSLIQDDLEKMTGAEELQFEGKVKKLEDDIADRLRSLSTIPPDISTYPPVLSSLMTHERYTYALQRPNPAPSTSLLTSTVSRRPARDDPLAMASSSSEPSWTSRSMLGEPDAPLQDNSPNTPEEQNKSRWSFWGRRPVPERQLTTSGGGVLERKSLSIASPEPNNERSSTDLSIKPSSKPSSRAPSIAAQPSRPSSPAPSTIPSGISDTMTDIGHSTPSAPLPQSQPIQAAPSAVSRFFGRLSRNKSSASANTQDHEGEDGKDLELSADDFSFLSEVPSISQQPLEKGVGDLLALEPGRNEQIASLESLLSSKTAALPKPLAPPPKGPSALPGMNSGNRSNSGKFVARMKSPPPTDMDLLGDLNFDGSTRGASTTTQSPIVQSPVQAVSSPSNAWDDFLALQSGLSLTNNPNLASNPKSPSTPTIAPPLVPSRSNTPTVSLSPPPPSNQSAIPSIASVAVKPPLSTPANKGLSNDFGDFDDFGTPQHASTSTFDDFGDFSAFENPSASHVQTPDPKSTTTSKPLPMPFNISNSIHTPNYKSSALSTPGQGAHRTSLSTPTNHTRPGSLDHTPTLNLLSGASASKGKRWPAPPSPVAPALAPPPKPFNPTQTQTSSNANNSFPFLSPPPPGRPNSRSNNLLDEAPAGNDHSPAQTTDSSGNVGIGMGIGMGISSPTNQSVFGGALQPARSSTPTQITQNTNKISAAIGPPPQGQSKGGLSASDLSFFDSL